MNRITKIVYFSILFIVALGQIMIGNPILGLSLIVLLVLAMQWFEKREAGRQFYRALRKIYVCVDNQAYGIEIEKLKKNRLIKTYSATRLQLLEAIWLYYNDRSVEARTLLSKMQVTNDLAFWKHCYLLLIQLKLNFENDIDKVDNIKVEWYSETHALLEHIENEVKFVPLDFREIATQRVAVLELMMKDHLEIVEIERLRDLVNYNLLMAELTKLMVIHASDERIRNYYQKGFINLSRGISI